MALATIQQQADYLARSRRTRWTVTLPPNTPVTVGELQAKADAVEDQRIAWLEDARKRGVECSPKKQSFLSRQDVDQMLQAFSDEIEKTTGENRVCMLMAEVPFWDDDEDEDWAENEWDTSSDGYQRWAKQRADRDALRTPEALSKIPKLVLPRKYLEVADKVGEDFDADMGDEMICKTTSTAYKLFLKLQQQLAKVKKEAAKDPQELFLHLWAIFQLYKDEQFCFRKVERSTAQKPLTTFSSLWKQVLVLPADQLGIDAGSWEVVISELNAWKKQLRGHFNSYAFNFLPDAKPRKRTQPQDANPAPIKSRK